MCYCPLHLVTRIKKHAVYCHVPCLPSWQVFNAIGNINHTNYKQNISGTEFHYSVTSHCNSNRLSVQDDSLLRSNNTNSVLNGNRPILEMPVLSWTSSCVWSIFNSRLYKWYVWNCWLSGTHFIPIWFSILHNLCTKGMHESKVVFVFLNTSSKRQVSG